MVSEPHSGHETHADEHGHGPLHHHFDDMDQQRECTSLGMWAFLVTEIMMFGGLFFAYTLYRSLFSQAFVTGAGHLNITYGTINTFILLFSSYTVARAVHAAQMNYRKALVGWLVITWVFGAAFLGIKAVEWYHDYELGLVPGVRWNSAFAVGAQGAGSASHAAGTANNPIDTAPPQGQALRPEGFSPGTPGAPGTAGAGGATGDRLDHDATQLPGGASDSPKMGNDYQTGLDMTGDSANSYDSVFANQVKMFFVVYFCMTGLHAIHMIVGLLLVGYFIFTGAKGQFLNGNDQPVEIMGLYWHLIDIIWIFLFPLLYLIPGFHPFGGGH